MNATRYLVLIFMLTFFAVLDVAQRACVYHLGYRVERLQAERALQAERNRRLLCEISALSDPGRIAEEIRRLDATLLDPVRLSQASAVRSGDRAAGTGP